jgi:hypothetical protein
MQLKKYAEIWLIGSLTVNLLFFAAIGFTYITKVSRLTQNSFHVMINWLCFASGVFNVIASIFAIKMISSYQDYKISIGYH